MSNDYAFSEVPLVSFAPSSISAHKADGERVCEGGAVMQLRAPHASRFIAWTVHGSQLHLVELSAELPLYQNEFLVDLKLELVPAVCVLESPNQDEIVLFVTSVNGLVHRYSFAHPSQLERVNQSIFSMQPQLFTRQIALAGRCLQLSALSITTVVLNCGAATVTCALVDPQGPALSSELGEQSSQSSLSATHVKSFLSGLLSTSSRLLGSSSSSASSSSSSSAYASTSSYSILATCSLPRAPRFVLAVCSDGVMRVLALPLTEGNRSSGSGGSGSGAGVEGELPSLVLGNFGPLTSSLLHAYPQPSSSASSSEASSSTSASVLRYQLLVHVANRAQAKFHMVELSVSASGQLRFSAPQTVPSQPERLIDAALAGDRLWAMWRRRSQTIIKTWHLHQQLGWVGVMSDERRGVQWSKEDAHRPFDQDVQSYYLSRLHVKGRFHTERVLEPALATVMARLGMDNESVLPFDTRLCHAIEAQVALALEQQAQMPEEEALSEEQVVEDAWADFLASCVELSASQSAYLGFGASPVSSSSSATASAAAASSACPAVIKRGCLSAIRPCDSVEVLHYSTSSSASSSSSALLLLRLLRRRCRCCVRLCCRRSPILVHHHHHHQQWTSTAMWRWWCRRPSCSLRPC